MKICFLCADVDIPIMGSEGCSVKIRQFCDTLIDQGHDVSIACAWIGESDGAHTKARVEEIRPNGSDAAVWSALESEPAVTEANLERDLRSIMINGWLRTHGRDVLGAAKPDLVYERYALFGHAGAELARELGAAHLLEVNAPLCREQEGYEKFPLIRTAEAVEGEILRSAGTVVTVSAWLAEFALQHGVERDRVEVMPNGVAPYFAGTFSGAEVRARLGLDERRVIGYLGSFQPWHDLDGLVEAFARVRQSDADVRLLLVGGGPEREAIARKVESLSLSEDVVITGHLPPDEIPEHIAAMDVAVSPYASRADFYFSPLKLFECMAVGTPNVAARVGQIEEVVDDGETGLLYPPGDSAALARVLRRVLNEPGHAQTVGAAGRQKVLAEHTMAANAERVVGLAERLR